MNCHSIRCLCVKVLFHFSVIGNCVQVLVQDLESACDPALLTMTKVSR